MELVDSRGSDQAEGGAPIQFVADCNQTLSYKFRMRREEYRVERKWSTSSAFLEENDPPYPKVTTIPFDYSTDNFVPTVV